MTRGSLCLVLAVTLAACATAGEEPPAPDADLTRPDADPTRPDGGGGPGGIDAGSIFPPDACVSQPEICNGADDDCDGTADDGDPGSGAACMTGVAGICGPGTMH